MLPWKIFRKKCDHAMIKKNVQC